MGKKEDKEFDAEAQSNLVELCIGLSTYGNELINYGVKNASDVSIARGNVIRLLGSVLLIEDDVIELENFLGYFTGKKITEKFTPDNILLMDMVSKSLPDMGPGSDLLDLLGEDSDE